MRVYLVRHGEAVPESEDSSRPLSSAGRSEVEHMASHLASIRSLRDPVVIQHSGKLRALQTADIIAISIGAASAPEAARGLAPGDALEPALDMISTTEGNLMLVGHLPHIGRLAAHLLTGDPDRPLLYFKTATVACLVGERGQWSLEWMLSPLVVA